MVNPSGNPLRIASVIASLTAGGIGPVCLYAAEGMARVMNSRVTLLSLHDPVCEFTDEASGLRVVCLGLDGNCPQLFLQWLRANPQDLIITSDVCHIEAAFRFLPPETRHIIQMHDSGRRYREVAVRHAPWIDGVTCVGQHIEEPLRRSLEAVGYCGLLRTVHNGADFPPLPRRAPHHGPLRLLFMGRVEALKGAFDLVPILGVLKKLGVPVSLNIVGGDNEILRRQLQRRRLADCVTWAGRVPHDQCYSIAAEADIFLMTSRKEPFGMVTIEAMSMGCVPIAYNIPSGSTEIIEHGESGLLVPLGDIRAYAEHICNLHPNRQRLTDLSAGAIDRARKCFNAATMAQGMADFISAVIAHSQWHPAKREAGLPPETTHATPPAARGYQRLPAGLREWIRNQVGSRPRLCHRWLNR
jgi:hypothetical protein